MDRGEVSALLSPSRRRSQLRAQREAATGSGNGGGAVSPPPRREEITIDAPEEEAFLRTLEEQLQQRIEQLDQIDLVLGAKQINYLAFRLHEALEPKRDPETNVIQAWTIQPQAQLKIKMSSHIQVLKLSTILREVRHLRIHQQSLLRSPIEMEIFPSLYTIEIVHTEIAALRNVHFFARQLKKFRLEHTPLESLTQILSPTAREGSPLTVWKRLESLRINCCALPSVDACFNELQGVRIVDLAWNEITRFEMPAESPSLEWLDLCHNHLSSIPPLSRLRNLKVLDLSVNAIQSLDGIQTLTALIDFDISNNNLRDIGEIELLTALTELRRLVIRENPIARRPDYRREVLFYLGERIEVDDEPWSLVELQSMKNCRKLQQAESLLDASASAWVAAPVVVGTSWVQTSAIKMVYPPLRKVGGMLAREADIAPPPRLYSPQRRMLQMQQHALTRNASAFRNSQRLERSGTRSSVEGTTTDATEDVVDPAHADEPLIQTVDDYFRLQTAGGDSGAVSKAADADIPIDGTINYESDSDDSSEGGRNRSRKYTESDFMRDFEEEEAIDPQEIVTRTRRSSSSVHKKPLNKPDSGVNVRVLLSAEDAAVFDLVFGIDGVAAMVTVKSNEILETLHVPERESAIGFSRRLPDVVAIGTSTHSTRAKIVVLKLRKLDHSVGGVTYQVEATPTLARLLAPLLGHLYAVVPGHQSPTACVCSNCGGVSHLSPEFVGSTADRSDGVADAIVLHSCLLCASYNVREVSSDRVLSMYTTEGMPLLAKRVKPASVRRAQVEVGFSVEEHDLDEREALEIHHCVLIASNGIREAMNASITSAAIET